MFCIREQFYEEYFAVRTFGDFNAHLLEQVLVNSVVPVGIISLIGEDIEMSNVSYRPLDEE